MSRGIRLVPVRKSVVVNAPPERAFDVFTARFDLWWPRSHSVNSVPMKEVVMEPRVGGRWYEKGEDGSECEWGKVLIWEPPSRVVLGWQLGPQFRFVPGVVTEVEIRFIAETARVTRVELEHRDLERFGEHAATLRDKVDSPNGWTRVLAIYSQFVGEAQFVGGQS